MLRFMNAIGHHVERRGMASSYALSSAECLRRVLRSRGCVADVHDGYGLALVSVWVGLVIWCDGERFWWRSGWDERRNRAVYAWHPSTDPDRAADRIRRRYEQLRTSHGLPAVAGELASAADGPTSTCTSER
jgi:hypothetical protein